MYINNMNEDEKEKVIGYFSRTKLERNQKKNYGWILNVTMEA